MVGKGLISQTRVIQGALTQQLALHGSHELNGSHAHLHTHTIPTNGWCCMHTSTPTRFLPTVGTNLVLLTLYLVLSNISKGNTLR